MERCPNDGSFGPVSDCRDFDFTVQFEQTVLIILPVLTLCLLTVAAACVLNRRSARVKLTSRLLLAKLILNVCFLIATLALAASLAGGLLESSTWSRWAATMIGLEGLALFVYSVTVHRSSIAPSTMLGLYLAITVLTNIVIVRTSWLTRSSTRVLVTEMIVLLLRCLLNVTENWSKRSIIKDEFLKDCTSETVANFWSAAAQLWLLPLFNYGFSRKLDDDDLKGFYSSSRLTDDAKQLANTWEVTMRGRPSLFIALLKTFWWPISYCSFPGVIHSGATLALPELINRFTEFTASYSTSTPQPASYGWGLAFSFFLVFLTLAFSAGAYMILTIHLGTRLRGAVVSLLYAKSLTISADQNHASSGKASTYMSVDIQKLFDAIMILHSIWQNLLIVAIALYLLYIQIEYAMFVVFGVIMTSLMIPSILAPATVAANTNWSKHTEARISLITSFLQNMKTIKLSAYEQQVVEPLIAKSRSQELKYLGKWYRVLVCSIFFGETIEVFSTATGFMAYALIHVKNGRTLELSRVFTALSLIIILVGPISEILHSLPLFFAAYGSLGRLEEFLLTDDIDRVCSRIVSDHSDSKLPGFVDIEDVVSRLHEIPMNKLCQQIRLSDAAFAWSKGLEPCLKGLSLAIPVGELTMIIGEVGSGKTCLLQSLLNETYLVSGQLEKPDLPIALCTQDAWIQNATFLENIVGNFPYDVKWYSIVLHACDLVQDLELLQDGGQTQIGSKGQNLSGGQKQRIALARACYSRAPIYFLDDVFSAIDKTTEARVFTNLFGPAGLLKDKTVLLVSHGISRLSSAAQIVLLENGSIAEQGTWLALHAHPSKVTALLAAAHTKQDKILDEFKAVSSNAAEESQKAAAKEVIQYERGLAVYKWYFSLIGVPNILLAFVFVVIYAGTAVGSQLWLKHWASESALQTSRADSVLQTARVDSIVQTARGLGYYIGVLWILTVINCASFLGSVLMTCYLWSIRTGQKAHRTLSRAVLNAKFSWFNSKSVGFIINRFSQDIFALDFQVPVSLVNVLFPLMQAIAQLGVICAAVPYIAVAMPFIFTGLFLLQRYFVRTSRQIKTLSLESKTPLYTSFLETLEGVCIIRAGKLETSYAMAMELQIALSQPPFFLQYAVNRGLKQVLDLTTMFLGTCLAILAVATRHTASAGLVGLAFIQVISLQQNLNLIITNFTNLETAMIAVERIQEFTNLPPEDKEARTFDREWLKHGNIRYENVSAKYRDDVASPLTLRHISFYIRAGEKIGICGRTGSGKSSLLLTLFRAMDHQTGRITIDGQDTAALSLKELRSSLTMVPQDPSLWQATVRDNLDPLHHSSDIEIWTVLHKVGLGVAIHKLDGELDHVLLNGGAELSAGQRQLLCLARACLRKSKIVVLDEATSSMDILTDQIVQDIIRTVFKDATVITIAHRIQTIIDYDKIMILDAGSILEYDDPKVMLSDPNSRLRTMRVSGFDFHDDENGEDQEVQRRERATNYRNFEIHGSNDSRLAAIQPSLELRSDGTVMDVPVFVSELITPVIPDFEFRPDFAEPCGLAIETVHDVLSHEHNKTDSAGVGKHHTILAEPQSPHVYTEGYADDEGKAVLASIFEDKEVDDENREEEEEEEGEQVDVITQDPVTFPSSPDHFPRDTWIGEVMHRVHTRSHENMRRRRDDGERQLLHHASSFRSASIDNGDVD